MRDFFHEHSLITELQGKEEGNSLTPQYHFHPLHRRLYISRTIIAELTSALRQHQGSNQDPLASECKFLTTKLRTLNFLEEQLYIFALPRMSFETATFSNEQLFWITFFRFCSFWEQLQFRRSIIEASNFCKDNRFCSKHHLNQCIILFKERSSNRPFILQPYLIFLEDQLVTHSFMQGDILTEQLQPFILSGVTWNRQFLIAATY